MALDPDSPYARQLAEIEKQMLAFSMESADEDVDVAANRLGVSRGFLRKRLVAVGLDTLSDPPKSVKATHAAKVARLAKATKPRLDDLIRNPPPLDGEDEEFAALGDT